MEELEVAVVLVTRDPRVLLTFNPSWGAFTFPMTKRRTWQDPNLAPARREESWKAAAVRAAGEALGRTVLESDIDILADIPEWRQSDREGVWKRYHFQVFGLKNVDPRPGVVTEWLTLDEILDDSRGPISPTARYLIARTKEEVEQVGRSFW